MEQATERFLEDEQARSTAETVDIWATLAAKTPRIVAAEADAGPDALWVGEVPLGMKLAIFTATFAMGEAARQAAAEDFRAQPVGGTAG